MKSLLKYFALIVFTNAIAQDHLKITPPNPEAAALTKCVDMPVSYYNGTANVSIPIYTATSGSLSVPVYLTYNGSGNQVSEIASRVGLGWTLSAGGVISRQARGMPDDTHLDGYINYHTPWIGDVGETVSVGRQEYYGRTIGDFPIDQYPDVFNFSFLNFSGKFIFDQITKQPILIQNSDLSIEVLYGNLNIITGFRITDNQGTKYFFTNLASDYKRITHSYSFNFATEPNSGTYGLSDGGTKHDLTYNTWYLTSITNINGDQIGFVYTPEIVNYYTKGSEVISGNKTTSFTEIREEQYQLSHIGFDNGVIHFMSPQNETREDLEYGKRLSGIDVELITSSNSFQTIKSFVLDHSYTVSTATSNNSIGHLPTDAFAKKRLILNRVKEIESTSPIKYLTTEFEYDPQVLPSRHSTSVDNWGYFNGKNNGLQNDFRANPLARQVDLIKSSASILKKITHPTGGTTEFIYEHNRVKTPNFFKEELLIPYNNPRDSKLWGFKPADLTNTVWNSTLNKNVYESSLYEYNHDTSVVASIAFDPEIFTYYNISLIINNSVIRVFSNTSSSIKLNQGTYKITAEPKVVSGVVANPQNNAIIFSIHYLHSSPEESQELYVGGKRIKEIIKKDNDLVQLRKIFDYTDSNGSTGRILAPPADYGFKVMIGNNATYQYANNIRGPLTSPFGNGLGYTKVTESFQGNDTGKTEYYFETFDQIESLQPDYYKFPYNYPNDYDWCRGDLIKQIDYYHTSFGYKKLKETINEYAFYGTNAINPLLNPLFDNPNQAVKYHVRQIPLITFIAQSTSVSDPWNYYMISYMYGGDKNIRKTTVKEYPYNVNSAAEGTPLITETRFNYVTAPNDTLASGQKFHNQLKETIQVNSVGEEIKTLNHYAYDASMENEPLRSLMDTKKMNPLIMSETYRNGSLLSAQKTIYKQWDNSIVGPERFEIKKGNNAFETRNTITKVDTEGNVLEYNTDNGITTSLIWGYNKTHVVAKIENMNYNSIPVNLLNEIIAASNTISSNNSTLEQKLDSLYTDPALVNAKISTFSYLPLVGVSRVTDISGKKIRYTYDGLNRLKYIIDNDGNYLSTNEYNYRTN